MKRQTGNFGIWKRLFARRAARPLPPIHADLDYTKLPASLARSLAVFQLGESGGGTVVEQAKLSTLTGIDDDYADALGHFVAEEHRHANILAICVRLLGGELIRENWTARLFVFGRRLMGLRFKILVLLAAEVVGLCYYRLIASRLPPCDMRDWLMEIVSDERDHLAFHCRFFRTQVRNPLGRLVFTLAWRVLLKCGELAVLIDHRAALRDLHIERSEVRSAWSEWRVRVEETVLSSTAQRRVAPAVADRVCNSTES